MRKFYATLLLVFVSILAFAQDKTVTIITNDCEHTVIRDCSWNIVDWNTETKSLQVVIPGDNQWASFQVAGAEGYNVTSVVSETTGESFMSSAMSDYVYVSGSEVKDGEVFNVTVAEKEPKVAYIKADASMVYLEMGQQKFEAADQVDGQWVITPDDPWAYIYVIAYDGYLISYAGRDDQGYNMLYAPATRTTLMASNMMDGANYFTIEAYDLEASRTSKFTLEAIGNVNNVALRRANDVNDVPLTEGINEISFNPANEVPMSIQPVKYSSYFYKVTLNGEAVERSGSSYFSITPQNGDEVKVYTEFPEGLSAPIKINFTNDGTQDAVTRVMVDNDTIAPEVWQGENFTVGLGKNFAMYLNTRTFKTSVAVNGQDQHVYSSFSKAIVDETPLEIEVTAEKLPTYMVTINVTDPSHVNVSAAGEYTKLESTTTVFEVSQNNASFYITPSPTGVITAVTTDPEMTIPSNYNAISIRATSDLVINITTEPFVRDLKGVVYLAKGTATESYAQDNGWVTSNFGLGNYSYSNPNKKVVAMLEGYNFFDWCENDKPFVIDLWPNYQDGATVYYNNEPIEYVTWPGYEALKDFKNNDVVKIYPSEQTPLTITNEIQDGLTVNFTTDYVTEQPANVETLSVLPGTYYTISPEAVEGSTISVSINGEEATPNEDGLYVYTVDQDVNVVVSAKSVIATIGSDNNSANDVYNLQGIRVKAGASADDLKALPAGLYIVGGQKVVIR